MSIPSDYEARLELAINRAEFAAAKAEMLAARVAMLEQFNEFQLRVIAWERVLRAYRVKEGQRFERYRLPYEIALACLKRPTIPDRDLCSHLRDDGHLNGQSKNAIRKLRLKLGLKQKPLTTEQRKANAKITRSIRESAYVPDNGWWEPPIPPWIKQELGEGRSLAKMNGCWILIFRDPTMPKLKDLE